MVTDHLLNGMIRPLRIICPAFNFEKGPYSIQKITQNESLQIFGNPSFLVGGFNPFEKY